MVRTMAERRMSVLEGWMTIPTVRIPGKALKHINGVNDDADVRTRIRLWSYEQNHVDSFINEDAGEEDEDDRL